MQEEEKNIQKTHARGGTKNKPKKNRTDAGGGQKN